MQTTISSRDRDKSIRHSWHATELRNARNVEKRPCEYHDVRSTMEEHDGEKIMSRS
jgi:hypothetical protein